MGVKNLLGKEVGDVRVATVVQFGSKYLNVGLQLVVTMVLARLLTPTEYGVMSVITVFLGLFSVISTSGISAAVIQYRELTDEDCGSLFVFTVLMGVIMALLLCALSAPIAWIYNVPSYTTYIPIASLSVVFMTANMVPNGMLTRDKRFFVMALRLIVTSVVTGVVAIVLALNGWGVYALITQNVLQSFLNTAWNLAASTLKVRSLHFVKQLKIVGKFSGLQFVAQVAQYLMRNLDNLLIGAVMGSTALGIYDKAYKLAKYPIDMVPAVLGPVAKTFFSSMEGDLERLYAAYLKIEKCLSILGVYFTVFCFFAAEELILLFFGDQWGDSVAPFRLLSLSIVFQLLNYMVFSILEGCRRTDYLAAHVGITSSTTLVLLLIGLWTGDLAITAGLVGLSFILSMIPHTYFVVCKAFGKSAWGFVKNFIPEFASGIVLAVVLAALDFVLPSNLLLSFVVKLVVSLPLYALLMWRTGQLHYLKLILKR